MVTRPTNSAKSNLLSVATGRNAQIAAIAEGHAERVKPTLSDSSQWPWSDRKGRKSCRCARRCLYPDRSSQRHDTSPARS